MLRYKLFIEKIKQFIDGLNVEIKHISAATVPSRISEDIPVRSENGQYNLTSDLLIWQDRRPLPNFEEVYASWGTAFERLVYLKAQLAKLVYVEYKILNSKSKALTEKEIEGIQSLKNLKICWESLLLEVKKAIIELNDRLISILYPYTSSAFPGDTPYMTTFAPEFIVKINQITNFIESVEKNIPQKHLVEFNDIKSMLKSVVDNLNNYVKFDTEQVLKNRRKP